MAVEKAHRPHRIKSLFWTAYYKILFRTLGVRYGRNLSIAGPLMLPAKEHARNIVIGDDVNIMPWATLKSRGGPLLIGNGVIVDAMCQLIAADGASLRIGDHSIFNAATIICAGDDITIGSDVVFAAHCQVNSSEHRWDDPDVPILQQSYARAPITIGDDVWFGFNAFVRKGVTIGSGSVIGAMSLVNADIPEFGVAAGVPARVIKKRGETGVKTDEVVL